MEERSMSRNLLTLAVVAGFALLFGPAQPKAQANCNSILNGTYGWEIEEGLIATSNTPDPKVGDYHPFATTGHFTFDGAGNFTGAHDTDYAGGHIHFGADAGTYNVNSDCATGTLTIANEGVTFNIVITSAGQEVKLTSSTTGRVFSGTLRVAASSCSAATLSGNSYGYASHGLELSSDVEAGFPAGFPRIGDFVPFSDAGEISFNADGSVSGTDNENLGGVFSSGLPIAGTYSVNADCTGTITMTIAGNNRRWNFVILQGADELIFVNTIPGFVWSGTLTKQ
jgi:hypothetical protein